MQMVVQVVVACVAAVMVVSPVRAQLGVCPQVEDKGDNATLLSNPYNCSTYYVCDHGFPTLMACAPGTEFSDVLKVCVYPKDADCVELPPPLDQPQADKPQEDQPLTETIVITETKKEIIKPVEPQPEAEPVA
ncbi:unnamed protein product [Ixodes hexagonus]